MQRKSGFFFAFCYFMTTCDYVEGTLVRKYPNFIWYFAHLFVPLHPISEINALITG
jgi:hypothetical protein